MSKKGEYDAKFVMTGDNDFRLEIKSEVLDGYFAGVLKNVLKQTDNKGKVDLNSQEKIELEPKYHRLLISALGGIIKQEKKNAADYGVNIMSYEVKKAEFVRKKKNSKIWDLMIHLIGVYTQNA